MRRVREVRRSGRGGGGGGGGFLHKGRSPVFFLAGVPRHMEEEEAARVMAIRTLPKRALCAPLPPPPSPLAFSAGNIMVNGNLCGGGRREEEEARADRPTWRE